MLRNTLAIALSLSVAAPATAMAEATLRGSSASMLRQNEVAKRQDYTFLSTPGQVGRFVDEGYLVRVEDTEDLDVLNSVSYPYARPELQTFLQRLSSQYREACGERLVVTSLTRPVSTQPRNAHPLSVHPAGMAVDFRVSGTTACRAWLEDALLELEQKGVLDVTRERRPPHYHVAVFPDRYLDHVKDLVALDSARLANAPREPAGTVATPEAPAPQAASAEKAPSRRQPLGPVAVIVLLAASVVAGARRRRGRSGDSL